MKHTHIHSLRHTPPFSQSAYTNRDTILKNLGNPQSVRTRRFCQQQQQQQQQHQRKPHYAHKHPLSTKGHKSSEDGVWLRSTLFVCFLFVSFFLSFCFLFILFPSCCFCLFFFGIVCSFCCCCCWQKRLVCTDCGLPRNVGLFLFSSR